MSQTEKQIVESIRSQYKTKEISKLDELKAIHKSVKRPADIFAYVFGTVGSLVLGAGMCLAMPKVIEGFMIQGIIIGLLGIAMVSANYFIHRAILNFRKNKYSDRIFKLSEEILGNKD